MPVYTFEIAPFLAGRSVTVRDASGVSVASGTLDENARFTASLAVGDYVASASDGNYTYRASGVVDQGDPDRLADSSLSSTFATAAALGEVAKAEGADRTIPAGFSATISASTVTVADMRSDGGQILLVGGLTINYSNDDMATTPAGASFAYATTAARYLANGEVLVAVNYNSSPAVKASLWVSSGWATNPATATFSKVLDAVSATSWFTNTWSLDTFKNYVIAAEYGPQGADNASRVWLSKDYGATWTLVFNLGPSADLRAHMHGVAYDRYWDRLWIANGDDVSNCAIRYSDDFGQTWTVYHQGSHQPVTILPMPKCVLFSSDMAPNGIYRAVRLPGRKLAPLDVPYTTDNATTLTVLGGRMYRRDEGSPALVSFRAQANVADVGRIVATQDGMLFHELWKDTPGFAVANGGITSVVGPTAKGNLIATLGGTSRGTSKLISPAPDWQGTRRHAKSHAPGGSDPLDLTLLNAADASVGAKMWIPAEAFAAAHGSPVPALTTFKPTADSHAFNAWTLDPASDCAVASSVVVPSSWTRMHIDVFWTEGNAAGTGDVSWRVWRSQVVDGSTLANASVDGAPVVGTAPTYPVVKSTRVATNATVSSIIQHLQVRRLSSQPTDTLTTNAAFYGLLLTKA